jgi:predicted MFS family arabinose efflux permease
MYGGVVGGTLGWRWAFLIESVAMWPVVVFCLTSAPIPLRGVTAAGAEAAGGVAEARSSKYCPPRHRHASQTFVS